MQKRSCKRIKRDSGNAMLITTILLLVMTVLVAACMNIAGMQFDLSMLQRNTSNTYYLAQSGVEKEVDMINKGLQTEMTNILEKIRKDFIESLPSTPKEKSETASLTATTKKYDNISYEDNKLQIKADELSHELKSNSYDFIAANYLNDPHLNNKVFKYIVKSDRQANGVYTEILVKAEAIYDPSDLSDPKKDSFKVTSTATSKDGTNVLDTQTVEATITINLPEKIDNEIREKYEWVGNPPEILDSAITCFSDMIVINEANLTVNGDIRVKGSKEPTTTSYWPDADESGGVIVSNGGKLNVNKRTTAPEDTTGNIYSMNNVATTNGWDGTDHYSDSSTITVAGDIIANTVAIFDDFYSGGLNTSPFGDDTTGNKVRNNNITVTKNIFTDNDVKIDQWVGEGRIDVAGSIFGISNNNSGGETLLDPNSSSGVYNQGINTLIKAKQMFVYGQPFIIFEEGKEPIKLWESVGKPFNGVDTLEKYNLDSTDADDHLGDPSYLKFGSPFHSVIKRDSIQIEDITNSYATAYISAKIPSGTTTIPQTLFMNKSLRDNSSLMGADKDLTQFISTSLISEDSTAGQLFNVGGYPSTLAGMTDIIPEDNEDGRKKKFNIIGNPTEYYKGALDLFDKPSMYKKFYTSTASDAANWQGLKAYMTAVRSVFYGIFEGASGSPKSPKELDFDKAVSLDSLDNIKVVTSPKWSYSNPIDIITSEDPTYISRYYVKDEKLGGTERPYPTIIVNYSDKKLILKADDPSKTDDSGKNIFNGIIISKGDVEIQENMTIEGAIIIGGTNEGSLPVDRKEIMLGNTVSGYSPGLKISDGKVVTITQNPNVFLEMDFANRSYLREVMDALKITQYKDKTNVGEILGPYNYDVANIKASNSSNPVVYAMGRVALSGASILDIKTNRIDVTIKNMKKVN